MALRIILTLMFLFSAPEAWPACRSDSVDALILDVKSAWAAVDDYRTRVEVDEVKPEGGREIRKFEYVFKKPNKIRILMESPDRGTILVYPDETGRVAVKPGGLLGFLRPRLDPGSYLFTGSSNQRLDQTDLGLLIENIARSVGADRLGPATLAEDGSVVRIDVLAADHFRKGAMTRYNFMIDRSQCLPVEVVESTPAGKRTRTVVFRALELNRGAPDSLFTLDKDHK